MENRPGDTPSLGVKILVVDDEAAITEGLEQLLAAEGYDVRVLNCGALAMRLVADWRPDLVLLDVVMQDVDGPTIADAIRELWPTLPVIFMTGSIEPERMQFTVRQPKMHVLTKPFRFEALLRVIAGAMR